MSKVKLLIEIEEPVYSWIKNAFSDDEEKRFLLETIANGKVITDDCISREALKMTLKKGHELGDMIYVGRVLDIIDSAPTVSSSSGLTEAEKIICKIYLEDLDKLHTCNEYKLLMSLIDNAPTGEPCIEYGTDGHPYKLSITNGKEYDRPSGIERDVVGYEGLYSVDIFGTVRNLLSGKVVEHYVNEFGYHNVYLYKNKEKKGKRVNRLVAMAFIPNPLNKPQVNHIDGNKDNNNVWNLEWATNKENSIHAGKTGLYGKGAVKIVETGEVFPNVSSLARHLSVEPSNIYKCLKGERNKVRGYHFEKVGADMRGDKNA